MDLISEFLKLVKKATVQQNTSTTSKGTRKRDKIFFCDNTGNSGDQWAEWRALYDDARSMAVDSGRITDVWKLFKFCFDETNPFLLIFILMNISGEQSWVQASTPALIHIVTSYLIGLYLCYEIRQTQNAIQPKGPNPVSSLFSDAAFKTLSLMTFHWFTELSREKKRKRQLEIIDDNLYKCEKDGHWAKREAIVEMTKFYSNQLSYLREDMLIVTIRSFSLAMFAIYKISDAEMKSLRLENINDYAKLAYIICVIVKTSGIAQSLQDTQRKCVAIFQLTGAAWQGTSPGGLIKMSNYHLLYLSRPMFALDFIITFLLIAFRYVTATFLIMTYGPLGCFLWSAAVILVNFLLFSILSESELGCKFENPPVGFFLSSKQKYLDGFVSVIFCHNGYSNYGLFDWKSLFVLCNFLIFSAVHLFLHFVVNSSGQDVANFAGTLSESKNNLLVESPYFEEIDNESLLPSFKFDEKDSLGIMAILNQILSLKPVIIFDYLSCVAVSGYYAVLLLFVALLIERFQRCLNKYQKVDPSEFANVFPFFVATDFYRSLIRNVLKIGGGGSRQGTELLRSFLKLTILNSRQFQQVWSSFSASSNKTGFSFEFLDATIEKICSNSLDAEQRLYEWRNNDYIPIHNTNDFELLERNEHVNAEDNRSPEEEMAEELLSYLQSRDHPLEPSMYNDRDGGKMLKNRLISSTFRYIQQQQVEQEKRNDFKLFIIFCSYLDTRLCEMSSSRIEQTFKMLHLPITKTFEDEPNNDNFSKKHGCGSKDLETIRKITVAWSAFLDFVSTLSLICFACWRFYENIYFLLNHLVYIMAFIGVIALCIKFRMSLLARATLAIFLSALLLLSFACWWFYQYMFFLLKEFVFTMILYSVLSLCKMLKPSSQQQQQN